MPESSLSQTVSGLLSAACSMASSCHSECTTHQKSCSTISASSSASKKPSSNSTGARMPAARSSSASSMQATANPSASASQRLGATHRAMAVGIGLDHRQRLARRSVHGPGGSCDAGPAGRSGHGLDAWRRVQSKDVLTLARSARTPLSARARYGLADASRCRRNGKYPGLRR